MLSQTIQLYKDAYSGLSLKSWYLSLVMLINRSGTMVIPFMTIYCTQKLGFSITQAGVIMAMFGLGAITGAFIGGKITDKIGFWYLQVGALLSGGVLFMLIGFLETFIGLCIGTFILSLCNESFRPANSTAIAYYSTPQNRTRSYSLNRLAINLGWAVGGALGGFLAGVDYHLLFWVDGCTNIFAGLLLIRLLPRVKKTPKVVKEGLTAVIRSAYKDKMYLFFIVLVILFATCFFQLFTIQPVFYKTEWHFTEQFIGILMAVNGLFIAFIEMVMVHRLENRRPPAYFISIGIFLVGLGYSLCIYMPGVALTAIVAVVILTFGEILSMPFMNTFWVARTNDDNRGEYAGLYTIAWSVAQVIAPTAGSMVVTYGGYNLLWEIITAICMISSLGFLFIYKIDHPLARRIMSQVGYR